MSDIQMYVPCEPFCFGIVQAHPKLSKIYLKKVISYARSKGADGGYPRLSWSIWKHMATNKMLLHENLAWGYFATYLNIKESTWEERLRDAELLQQSYESGDHESYKSNVDVDTMEFVLLLYLQQASKISLRTSLVGEEWPGSSPRARSPSPDTVDSGKASGISNIFDEGNQLSFVLTNLAEILELISEPYQGNDRHKSDGRLSLNAIKSLGFIIKAYMPKLKTVVPLHTLAVRHRFQSKSGFSRTTNDFSCHTFEKWLRASLEQNPFGVGACISSGLKLKWMMPKRGRMSTISRCQILSNSQIENCSAHKMVYFTHCSYQTIARESTLLNGSYVKINKSNFSQFYLLSPLRFISIEKCQDSTFVLGPVTACIRIIGCHNVTVISPCRSIIIGSSRNVTAHIATSTQPLIIGDSSPSQRPGSCDGLPMVTLAPYHTHYGQLEQHLATAGLVISPQMNQWDKPICLSHLLLSKGKVSAKLPRRRTDGSDDLCTNSSEGGLYRILPPSDFFSFAIPFQTSVPSDDFTPTTSIPWNLPAEYAQSLKQKQYAISKYKSAVRNAKMTSEQKETFQALVEKRFKEWLESTGNKRQLDDLADLTKAFES